MLPLVSFFIIYNVIIGNPTDALYGGRNASIDEYPHQVALESSGSYICGGSIIHASYILTSAKCVNEETIRTLKIRSGSTFRESNGTLHDVASIIVHEDFRIYDGKRVHNDIALVKLSEPLNPDSTRQIITMFESNETTGAGSPAKVTGWGQIEDKTYPVELRVTSVPVIAVDTCKESYRYYREIFSGQLCAGYFGHQAKGVCFKDEGGSMLVAGRLAGIVIRDLDWTYCVSSKFPDLYTEVAYYRDWIDRHLN